MRVKVAKSNEALSPQEKKEVKYLKEYVNSSLEVYFDRDDGFYEILVSAGMHAENDAIVLSSGRRYKICLVPVKN